MLPLSGPAAGLDRRQVGREAPRDLQRRQPLREDRRPRRELPPVRRQGDGLRLLPPDRRPVQRAAALHLRDGRRRSRPWASTARRSPTSSRPVAIGDQGYTSAGSTLFYAGQVLHPDRLDPGRPQVRRLRPGSGQAGRRPPEAGRRAGPRGRRDAAAADRPGPTTAARPSEARPPAAAKPAAAEVTPATSSPCCRPRAARASPSTSPRTSSAIASCPTSSWPITRRATSPGRASSAPISDAKEAKAVFEKYIEGVKKDGAEVKPIAAEGADEMVISTNIGLVDVVFRKGNTLAGANGATEPGRPRPSPGTGQEPAGQRPDDRQVNEPDPESRLDVSSGGCNPPVHGDGIRWIAPDPNRGRNPMSEKLTRTQQKNLEKFGGVNPADQPFSRRQFAAQVGGFALAAGGAVAGGLLLRDRWGMEGVKPPPPVRLKDYSRHAAASAGPAWSSSAPARPRRGPRLQGRGAQGPRGAGLLDGQGGARHHGGRRPLHPEGGRRRHQAERRLRQEPRPRRHHPARHRRRRDASSAWAPAPAR